VPNTNTNAKTTDFLRATFEHIGGSVVQQVEDNFPLTAAIKASGNVETVISDGKFVEWPLIRKNIGTFDWTDQSGINNSAQPDILSNGQWEWKYAGLGFDVPKHMLDLNSGKSQIVNLMQTYKDQAQIEFEQNFQLALLSDGSAAWGGWSKAPFDGLGAIFPSTGTASNLNTNTLMQTYITGSAGPDSYAGVKRSSDSYWRVQSQSGHDTAPATITAAAIVTFIRKCSNDAMVDAPNIALVDPPTYDYLNSLRTGASTWIRSSDRNDDMYVEKMKFGPTTFYPCSIPGFSWATGAGGQSTGGYAVGGGVTTAATSNILFLNTKYLKLFHHGSGVTVSINDNIPHQNVIAVDMYYKGNLACTRLNRQGIMINYKGA
jgi:hypothetical protein